MAREGEAGGTSSGRALREFFATEVAGGAVLAGAALVALLWANSPWSDSYERLWTVDLEIELRSWSLGLDLRRWVNDGLMSFFFLLVAIEVKREVLDGELRNPRTRALPVIAAIGGMVAPALLYLAINGTGEGARGWGIPMATDIAFALGVAALVARSLPPGLRLFLLALAIVDDIGAILVIAFFYSGGVDVSWLGVALALGGAVYALQRSGVTFPPAFVVLGVAMWVALHEAGVHPTLAGVAMGLLVPARPARRRDALAPMERLEHLLHPWTSLAIVPLFALANAGVSLSRTAMTDAVTSPVAWGVLVGLVVGKMGGISGSVWLASRFGLATLPAGATWRQLVGVSALAGIGFTVSLFVTSLAFERADLVAEAKIGILSASLVATAVGSALLLRTPASRRT